MLSEGCRSGHLVLDQIKSAEISAQVDVCADFAGCRLFLPDFDDIRAPLLPVDARDALPPVRLHVFKHVVHHHFDDDCGLR